MRLLIVGAALLFTTTAAAQSRWTVSTGPEWSRGIPALRTWGLRARAEYDLTKPNSVFGLRFETGARWSPTQSYFYSSGFDTQSGMEQRVDLMLGLNASLSPIPHARVSPYVTFGVFGRQEWMHGSWSYGSGSNSWTSPLHSITRGDMIGAFGGGLRFRLGGHAFQMEYRWIHSQAGLTFGTRLPF